MNYKFGTKNNWRRWAWNRLAERVKNGGDSLVLFMPSADALDIDVALSKGFARRNLIAVERDESTLAALRRKNIPTINGDILDVLVTWPMSPRVGVVFLDFCCGLEKRVIEIITAAQLFRAFIESAWCVNLLRGRDATSSIHRSLAAELLTECGAQTTKHRGVLLYLAMTAALITDEVGVTPSAYTIERRLGLLNRSMAPETNSYASTAGSQLFDSLVWSGIGLGVPTFNVNALDYTDTEARRREICRDGRMGKTARSSIATRAVLNRARRAA